MSKSPISTTGNQAHASTTGDVANASTTGNQANASTTGEAPDAPPASAGTLAALASIAEESANLSVRMWHVLAAAHACVAQDGAR